MLRIEAIGAAAAEHKALTGTRHVSSTDIDIGATTVALEAVPANEQQDRGCETDQEVVDRQVAIPAVLCEGGG